MGGFFSRLIDSLLEPLMWLVIVWVYLSTLNNPDLGQASEVFVMQVAREMAASGSWFQFTFNQQPFFEVPPLYPWIIRASFELFGPSLWAARLPGALIALAGLFLTNTLSVSLLSNRLAGFLTTVILACSWGYFWCGHDATGNILWMVLLTVFSWLFHWFYQIAARPRYMSWERTWLPVGLGLMLGLMFLCKGIVGLLFPTLLIVGFIGITGNLERYASFDWRGFSIALLLLILPWPVLAAVQSGDWTLLFTRFIQLPHVYGAPGESYWNGLMNGFLFWMFPWWVFLIGGFVDPKGFRQLFYKHNEAMVYLYLWIGLGLVLPLLLGETGPAVLITAYIPMMILSGLYLTRMLEGIGNSSYYQWAADGITVLIFGFAVLLTFFIFQYLPDEYPGNLWQMPGPATITTIFMPLKPGSPFYDSLVKLPIFNTTLTLPNLFPVWKLWLVPFPFFLIICGMMIYYLNKSQRSEEIPPAMLAMAVISLVFISTVALPVTSRPIIQTLAQPVNLALSSQLKQAAHTAATKPIFVAIHVANSPDLLRFPFFINTPSKKELEAHAPKQLQKLAPGKPPLITAAPPPQSPLRFELTHNAEKLLGFFQSHQKNDHYFVVLDEKTYYALPPGYRAKTRVLQTQWQWCLGEQERAFCWLPDKKNQGNFHRMTDELILLEGLTPDFQ